VALTREPLSMLMFVLHMGSYMGHKKLMWDYYYIGIF